MKYARINLKEIGVPAILSYYPLAEWEACHYGSIMLYGHLHSNLAPVSGRILNVCYDLHGKILSVDEIWKYVKDIVPKTHDESVNVGESEDDIRTRALHVRATLEGINLKTNSH